MNKLKEIRESKGLSQFELAKIANITPTDISRIENEKIFPYRGWKKRIAQALNVPEEKIFIDE